MKTSPMPFARRHAVRGLTQALLRTLSSGPVRASAALTIASSRSGYYSTVQSCTTVGVAYDACRWCPRRGTSLLRAQHLLGFGLEVGPIRRVLIRDNTANATGR